MMKIFTKILFILLLTTSLQANELWLTAPGKYYYWIKSGNDPKTIQVLTIQDGYYKFYKDEDFAKIAEQFNNLTSLSFNVNEALSDASLLCLAKLPKLKELHFRENAHFSDRGLLAASRLVPQIEVLSLEGPLPMITGESFVEVIKNLPHLRFLRIDRGVFHHQTFLPWRILTKALINTKIEELTLAGGFDTGKGNEAIKAWAKAFSKMPVLQKIELSSMKETSSRIIFEALESGKPDLEHVTLSYSALSYTDVNPFPSRLKSLCFKGYIWADETKTHSQAVTELILLASDLLHLEILEIYPFTYEEDSLLQLQESVGGAFPSLKILRLHSNDYKHVGPIAHAIKQKRPDLQVFLDNAEIR